MALSVGPAAYYRAPIAAGGPTAPEPAPYVQPAQPVPTPQGSVGASGFMDVVKGIFSGVVNFFKGIWNKLFGGKTPSGPLDADTAAIAKNYRLLANRENVQAFLLEARSYEQNGTIGPGSPDSNAIQQVQQALASWGFPVNPNGKYDQQTAAAIIQFKMRNGLHQNYRSEDGNWAVNEYLDNQTLTKMRELIQGGTQPPVGVPAPGPAPTPSPAPAPLPGNVNWAAVATQYGLQPSQENVSLFLAEVGKYNQGGALGPGQGPERAADIKELQRLLKNVFGYTGVTESGTFDQATAAAVIEYKKRNGLKQTYRAADGNFAINEYADIQTLQLMLQQSAGK